MTIRKGPVFGSDGLVYQTESMEGYWMAPKEKRYAKRIHEAIEKYSQGPKRIKVKDIVVQVNGLNFLTVACRGGSLPAPFDRCITIEGFVSDRAKKVYLQVLWDQYGRAIDNLLNRTSIAQEIVEEIIDAANTIATGSGIELQSYRPYKYNIHAKHGPKVVIKAIYRMIDETLNLVDATFNLENRGSVDTRYLIREAKMQPSRKERQKSGYVTDSIMFEAMKSLPKKDSEKLLELMSDDAPHNAWKKLEHANLEVNSLGIKLPQAIETIKVKNGQISGRIRLSESLSFNRKRLLLSRILPRTLIEKIKGKRLGEVIEHPWLTADIPIKSCKLHENNRTSIVIDVPLVYYPSGKRVPDKE